MMTVPMDSSCAPSSRELAQSLYKKNVELENGLRKSAQSRIPSDPNTWFQMRENYEVIILEDHDFSEKHEMEFALWQLHYRRIEEFRARINATASAGSVASQSGKIISRPDSIKKIRSVFKGFLSEATGFYHDLILKIRARYGLPLGYFSEGVESQTSSTNDGKKSAETKKGMVSCHRCLIYLGDLARYKGLYGEGDSISRDYAAATSYYLQAASLWPSSGNPHHQLAILASYSGDELGAVYRYFRSLAVDSPFSTARDNLVIAFEKNRQSYSQLSGNAKVASDKTLHTQSTGSERGTVRGDPRHQVKDSKTETIPLKERDRSFPEMLKTFSTRFVRFNGILFTRTSLESFNEIFSSAISDLHELLSSGPEEVLNFGQDASHCALVLVRLIMVLIFTVHNVKRDAEGQSYAEILQRTILLQNAFTAAYEFAGYIFKRCTELHDSTSSYLLPAILIFIEWLACNPDVTTSFDLEEKQSTARSFFWNQLVSFLNKLMLSGIVSSNGNEDDNCFVDMGRYEEGETSNRVALWEDFELRGFSPLIPAHLILDFSRKHSLGSVRSTMEKKTRVQRILAAGRALMVVVRIDQKGIYFDQNMKKFVIGLKPHASEPQPGTIKLELAASKVQLHVEGEEEEEIVFKPIATENYYSKSTAGEIIQPVQAPSRMLPSQLLVEQQPVLSARIGGNGLLDKHWLQTGLGHVQPMVFSSLVSAPSKMRALEPVIPSKLDYVMHSGPISDGPTMKPLAAVPMAPRKNPVSRPTRHLGPPPGFDHVPSKLTDGDYRWRDGHQPVASKGMVMTCMNHTAPHVSTSKSSNAFDLGTFPFPRKQASAAQYTVDNVNWQDYDPFENFKPFTERDLV